MILIWFLIIPMAGGCMAWLLERKMPGTARWIAMAALTANLCLTGAFWLHHYGRSAMSAGPWLANVEAAWIPRFGITFHLAADGLSLVLLLLTHFLGMTAVAASWTEITEKAGFFYFNLLWVLAGIGGVFLAMDLFLFYFFWEMMLIPMFFLIVIWGHDHRVYAGVKFFLFTQIGSLLMLAAILGLYVAHGRSTGYYTFNYPDLIGTAIPSGTAVWIMLGFFIAFAVKLPAFPVHSWLPDAHTEAPTAGSIILAGLLLKTGAYGLIRFAVPLFPAEAKAFAPVAMTLAVIAVLYGAWLAFAQTDLKRLVAYTSISHMGFVLLGIYTWNRLALQGVILQIICHGISTGALFFLAGALQARLHTRDLHRMGGLWTAVPCMAGMTLLFALASLGLPGLGNFLGEFLILLGAYKTHPLLTVLASLGLISAAVYSLWIVQAIFQGPEKTAVPLKDLTRLELTTLGLMAAGIIWLGLYPQPVFKLTQMALQNLEKSVTTGSLGFEEAVQRQKFMEIMPIVIESRKPYDSP